MRGARLVLLVGIATAALPAFGNSVLYVDFGSWSAAVQNITTVTIPEPVSGTFDFFGTGDGTVTYSGVTFTASSLLGDGNFFNVGSSFSGAPAAVLSDQQANSGVENILITFPQAVTAFALNFGTLQGSDVTFLLSNSDGQVLSTVGTNYSVPQFIGLTDDTPFTSVLVTSPDFGLNLNEVSYADAAAVPEPSTLGLFAIGALGLTGLLKLRGQSAMVRSARLEVRL